MTTIPEQIARPASPGSLDQRRQLSVCHVISGDLRAGAEIQAATVASYLREEPDVKLTAVLLNDGWLASELRRMDVAVTVIDESRYSAAAILAWLVRFFRNHPIDIVHTHRYKETVLGAIAAKLAGVRHVVRTVHGLSEPMRGWARLKFALYEALDKVTLWMFADRIIAVSRSMAEVLKRSGYRRDVITHLHNGVDLQQVNPLRSSGEVRRALGINEQDLLIGTAGRLSPVKGHVYMLYAAKEILKCQPRARFVFVGSGPLSWKLLATARSLGIENECRFVGLRADTHDLIAAMDIFVLPSLDEGIPMALLEAMALGRPLVATKVGGIPEIITPDADGLLVEPKDHRGLAAACLRLARDRQWAATLGARGRLTVEQRFSRERNGRALVRLYHDVSHGRRVGRRTVTATALLGALARQAADLVRQQILKRRERRRMNRIRRHPSELTAILRHAETILIVCHGNIIRSAFAARLIAQSLGDRAPVAIASAGLEAETGRPSHPTAVLTALPQVDLSHHSAARITADAVRRADVIFVMDVAQLLTIDRRFPGARGRTFLITCLDPGIALEVHDPVNGDQSVFQTCFDQLARAVRPIVGELTQCAE